ncbi:hypothetical protein UF31_00045, partial [Vibrio parahaemolyticus]
MYSYNAKSTFLLVSAISPREIASSSVSGGSSLVSDSTGLPEYKLESKSDACSFVARATNEQASDFDSSLYSGKPVESLTNDEPPETEEEAISRGDIALTNKNVDLALYEYIRSLSFPN